MKKIFLSLSFFAVAGLITLFAQKASVTNPFIEQAFKKEFPGAEFVKWRGTSDYSIVDFVLSDHRIEAFFNKQGELLESRRDLNYNQLPLAVMKELERSFLNANFSEIEEITNSVGTKYSVGVETLKRKLKVIVTPDGIASIIERTKK